MSLLPVLDVDNHYLLAYRPIRKNSKERLHIDSFYTSLWCVYLDRAGAEGWAIEAKMLTLHANN